MRPRAIAESSHGNLIRCVVDAALAAVEPHSAVVRHVIRQGDILRAADILCDLASVDRLCVVGAGKAAVPMSRALYEMVGERIDCGLVIAKSGQGDAGGRIGRMDVVGAAHPVPDQAGVAATSRVVDLASQMGEKDVMFVLISGGASSLLTLPAIGLELQDLRQTTELLLTSGAAIQELNAVRKHLSMIKGGQLARMIFPGRTVGLVLSDVVGDALDAIGSGPTVPDPSSFTDAASVLRRYGLEERVPVAVQDHLRRGLSGQVEETPGNEDPLFSRVQNMLVGSNKQAAKAAVGAARKHGLNAKIVTTTMRGEARVVGRKIAVMARELVEHGNPVSRPACLVFGGETTVTVRGPGKGGRNMELALAAAMDMEDLDDVFLLTLATDGEDGPTDAAGGVATAHTVPLARSKGLEPERCLDNNDSYTFFKTLGDVLITGPTRTNVADLVFLFAF